MIRILIVDDNQLVRAGLRSALEWEDDFAIAGEAASGEEALARLATLEVDLVLLDLLMPGMSGIETCREMKNRQPDLRVLVLTSSDDELAVGSSLLAGANGYLIKNLAQADLARAIRVVASGKSMLDPSVTEGVINRLIHNQHRASIASTATPEKLSERELEVIQSVARGLTNKQIAEALGIAEKTARNHVARILDKLALSRRSQAAAWAAQHGLIES